MSIKSTSNHPTLQCIHLHTHTHNRKAKCAELEKKGGLVNHDYKKSEPKIVDKIVLAEVDESKEKLFLCRCWKSKNFPYCDGAHTKHNKDTGDNVGPIAVVLK